jgi:hypothetical protein
MRYEVDTRGSPATHLPLGDGDEHIGILRGRIDALEDRTDVMSFATGRRRR